MGTFIERIAEIYRQRIDETSEFLSLLYLGKDPESYTYRQVIDSADGWRTFFRDRELAIGARVIVILPHSLSLYSSYLGACLDGLCPSMLHFPSPKFSREAYAETIGSLIERNGAQLVLTYEELQKELRDILPPALGAKVWATSDIPFGKFYAENYRTIGHRPDVGTPLFIQYSSGTTGIKKGVAITEDALDRQISSYSRHLSICENEIITSWLPLYHDMGLITAYFLPLLTGARLIAMSPFDWVRNPVMLLEAISKYRGTYSWLPNFAYFHLAANISADSLKSIDLSSLKAFINCSEPVTKSAHNALLQKLAPLGLKESSCGSCYAMAETTFAVSSTSQESHIRYEYVDENLFAQSGIISNIKLDSPIPGRYLASSGKILADTEVVIVGTDGSILEERRIGQIKVRSPSLVSGYCGQDDSQEAFTLDGFLTGDLGYISDGHLFVTGRLKDLIIINGKNLYPHDIEEVVGTVKHIIPGRVVAVGMTNTKIGTEELVILVESHLQDKDSIKELKATISKRVAAAIDVVPAKIGVLPHGWLRKSSSGKLSRKANLDRYQKTLTEVRDDHDAVKNLTDLYPLTRDGIVRILKNSIENSAIDLSQDNLDEDTLLISSGILDSLGLVRFIVSLEKAYSITIAPEIHAGYEKYFETIGAVINLVRVLTSSKSSTKLKAGSPSEIANELPLGGLTDRAFKFNNYLKSTKSHDLLVFGNSRCFPMHSKVAAEFGYKMYNFAVSNSTLSDLLCYFQLVVKNCVHRIRRVIVSVEPSFFRGADPRLIAIPDLAKLVSSSFDPTLHPAQSREAALELSERERELFNTQRSFELAPRFYSYTLEHGDQVGSPEREVDQALNQRKLWKMSSEADSYRATMLMMYPKAPTLDIAVIDRFASFLLLCKQHNIIVDCFLPPLHHSLIEFSSRETGFLPIHFAVVDLLTKAFPNLKINDFLYVKSFGGDEEDFSDAGHMMAYNADLLLRKILSQTPYAE